MRAARPALVVSLILTLSGPLGCAQTVSIRSLEPGPVQIGPARSLVVLDSRGRRSARETVLLELDRRARAGGYFQVTDRSESGSEVRLAGRRAIVQGEGLSHGELGLRVDVLEWDSDLGTKRVTRKNEDGETVAASQPTLEGRVLLAFSLFEASGRAYLAEKEYEGNISKPRSGATTDQVLEAAAALAIQRFLADVTPRERRSQVRLDDEDEGQRVILETARRGAVAQAAEDAQRYLDSHPTRASAAYNLAVFLDAVGRYEEALASYDHALSLGGQDYYVGARADCARRLSAQRALSASARR